jgi:hypothetical protein
MGSQGGGTEFLVFHRNFVAQVLAWYTTTTFTTAPFDIPAQKASLVAPWSAVPAEMRALPNYAVWKDDEIRLDTGSPNFDNDDELGYFIESRIHNQFLHGAAAVAFNDPEIFPVHSPQTTLFYKLHGLVDHWWSKWQTRNLFFPNHPVPQLSGKGSDVFFPDRPVRTRSAAAPQPTVDPLEMTHLIERVKLLELLAFPLHATSPPVARHPTKHPHCAPV